MGAGPQPRWIRINNLKTSLDEEIRTTFSAFTKCSILDQLFSNGEATEKAYICDSDIPDLLATNVPLKDIIHLSSYKTGEIILQDKASCFPAHLALNSEPTFSVQSGSMIDGDFLDACAAPGNKTSHAASIIAKKDSGNSGKTIRKRIIFACERDAKRSVTLESMLYRAGTHDTVKVLAKQDFLALDPQHPRFKNVTHLLLDPSCSGSGIVGREDIPTLVLPKNPKRTKTITSKLSNGKDTGNSASKRVTKRKRDALSQALPVDDEVDVPRIAPPIDTDRLEKLSRLQARIIGHAFNFPKAQLVIYSTCSIHTIENEMVVLRALTSSVARGRAWRLLRRDEQPGGLRVWPHRGDDMNGEKNGGIGVEEWDAMTTEEKETFRDACIRCRPGGTDGTMGFFVVGFVRDPTTVEDSDPTHMPLNGTDQHDDEEWEGFNADEEKL